jgi:hypothetical protein
MQILPNDGSHKQRLKRLNNANEDPFDPRADHKSLVTDEIGRRAERDVKAPKSDDGYGKRKQDWNRHRGY